MKRKTLIVFFLLLICFNFVFANSTRADVALAGFARGGTMTQVVPKEIRTAVFENQIKPINDAFELNADLPRIERCANSTRTDTSCMGGVGIELGIRFPVSDLKKIDYSLVRDGEELNKVTDTAQVGDTIRFKPKKEEQEISPPSDWIGVGGNFDSPPIQLVNPREYNRLLKKARKKFDSRYVCGAILSEAFGFCNNAPPVFSPETQPFNENTAQYTSALGKTAYVVPARNGKKMGIQVFCTTEFEYFSSKPKDAAICKENQFNGIDCRVMGKEKKIEFSASTPLRCFYFVDKVIENGKATQADWLAKYDYLYRTQKTFQIIEGNKKVPVADFTYNSIEENGKKYIEYDASESYDSDGSIELVEWNFGDGSTEKGKTITTHSYAKPGKYEVSLKATDNDGFHNEISKTINTNQKPLKKLKANYNYETKKIEITPVCSRDGSVLIDIDQFNEDVKPILSIIEKQEIPCNQTTSIGPITPQQKPATYQTTAILEETKETATITINH